MVVENGNKAIAVVRFDEMGEFVNDDVFEQVFGFLDEFGIQANVFGVRVTASPFCLHTL